MNSRKPTVTVEDLLRVKRAEQPPVEFWAEFDRDLRAKQLAAIVEPRPWWAPLIKFGSRVSHLQVPIGATAVLALTFVTIREYRAPEVSGQYLPTVVSQVAPAVSAVDQSLISSDSVPIQLATTVVTSTEPSNVAENLMVQEKSAVVASSSVAQEALVVPREPSPSERYIAANLAAAQAADPRLIDGVFGVSMRQSEAAQPIRDPLAQVSASESRRARLLATALPVSATSSDSVVAPSDRVARHLTEERLYDTITRVGLKGDRVAIKF